mgnify:CR=1 FL=1
MADHKIKLDPGAAALLDALHGAGYAAYAVGGCVRDSLLGLTIGTSAPAPCPGRCWIDSGKSSASQRVYSTAP